MNIFKKLKRDEAVEFVTHLINFTNMHITHESQSGVLASVKMSNNITIRKKLEGLKIDLLFSDRENTPYIYKSRLNKICEELRDSVKENADLYKTWKVSKNI